MPPVKLAFNGVGPLDNFNAKLDFEAGADLWANGEVVVAREGAGRRLKLDMNSRLEGLTPAVIRPVFAGETTLKGDLSCSTTIRASPFRALHLVSANARLDIEGGKSADDILGLRVHAGAIPGAAQIGKLDLNASIVGPLDGATVEGDLDARQIHVAEGSLDHVSASFRAVPNGPLTDEATRIPFKGQAQVSGLGSPIRPSPAPSARRSRSRCAARHPRAAASPSTRSTSPRRISRRTILGFFRRSRRTAGWRSPHGISAALRCSSAAPSKAKPASPPNSTARRAMGR